MDWYAKGLNLCMGHATCQAIVSQWDEYSGTQSPISSVHFLLFQCHRHLGADKYWDPQLCKGWELLKLSQGLGSTEQQNHPIREHPEVNSVLTFALHIVKIIILLGNAAHISANRLPWEMGLLLEHFGPGMSLEGVWWKWRDNVHSPREALSSLATNHSLTLDNCVVSKTNISGHTWMWQRTVPGSSSFYPERSSVLDSPCLPNTHESRHTYPKILVEAFQVALPAVRTTWYS